jgi:hypothetical protein
MRKNSNQRLTLRGLWTALAIGGLVTFSSCNGDEAQHATGDPSREVMFLAYAQKGSRTRITETTTSTISSFNTFAIWSGDDKPLENLVLANVHRDLLTPPHNWTYAPPQLWPENGTIDFYNFSPYAPNILTNYDGDDNGKGWSDISINYTIIDPPSDITLPSNQQDLLAAVKLGVSCSAPAPVSLNFQHMLSRIQFKARPAAGASAALIHRVRFVHLSNSGKLALSPANVPDGDGFVYDDILPRDPLILWEDHNDPDTNYEFNFDPAVEVDDHSVYTNIITGEHAFMILPQETQLGGPVAIATYVDETNPADPDDERFYIRIDFSTPDEPLVKRVKYYVVREPLDPAQNLPLAFEAGRSYTFVVDVSGTDYIEFADVVITPFDEVFGDDEGYPIVDITNDPDPILEEVGEAYKPASHGGFAGSNIYWDNTDKRLTFDAIGVTDHERFQGLLFKYGSLVGISPNGNWAAGTALFTPAGINGMYVETTAGTYAATNWANVTVGGAARNFATDTIAGIPVLDMRLSGFASYLTTIDEEMKAYRGDVCAYLSGRPGIPDGYWRLPTSAEFDPGYPNVPFVAPGKYAIEGSFAGITSNNSYGAFDVNRGYRLTYATGKAAFFPASGGRAANGALLNHGTYGYYGTSSPNGANVYALTFTGTDTALNPAAVMDSRQYAFPVRCVKK